MFANLSKAILSIVNTKLFVPCCLIAAVLIRLIWIAVIPTIPDVADSKWYYERGLELAAGQGFMFYGKPTAFWPVGYPAFLGAVFWLFGNSIFIAKVANIVLYVGGMAISYALTKRIFASEFTARMVVLLLAFFPNQIAYSAELLSEILFTFLFLAGALLLIEARNRRLLLCLSGGVFGLAILVKSQVLFLPEMLLALSFLAYMKQYPKGSRLLHFGVLSALLYLSIGLIVTPWIIRNYRVFHTFVFVADNGGLNMFLGNSPLVTNQFGLPFVPEGVFDDYNQGLQRNEFEADNKLMTDTLAYMRAHPVDVIRRLPQKVWYLWSMDVEGGRLNERDALTISDSGRRLLYYFKLVSQAYYLIIMGLFVASLVYLYRQRRAFSQPLIYSGVCIALYITLTSLVFHGESRYHFPIIPWIVMYAAFLLEKLLLRISMSELRHSESVVSRRV